MGWVYNIQHGILKENLYRLYQLKVELGEVLNQLQMQKELTEALKLQVTQLQILS